MMLNLAPCFSSPRFRVFRKRSCFLTTPNTCSTFARTEDFACSAFFAAYWLLLNNYGSQWSLYFNTDPHAEGRSLHYSIHNLFSFLPVPGGTKGFRSLRIAAIKFFVWSTDVFMSSSGFTSASLKVSLMYSSSAGVRKSLNSRRTNVCFQMYLLRGLRDLAVFFHRLSKRHQRKRRYGYFLHRLSVHY